mgnify:CR=1 FL=1
MAEKKSILNQKEQELFTDCGCPASMLLQHMGEDLRNIEEVFLKHCHSDHAGGLPMLIQDLQLTFKPKKQEHDPGRYGMKCVDNLRRQGIAPLPLDYVLFTHFHHDHYVSLPYLSVLLADARPAAAGAENRGPAQDVGLIVRQVLKKRRLAADQLYGACAD